MLKFGSIALASTAVAPLASYRAFGASSPETSNDPAVIFVWLPGGPPHQDTFDMKPDAPEEYRGAYKPINTNVPGIQICEHLPLLSKMADKYSLIRSVAHTFSDHGGGHKKFLTGRDPLQPTGFVNDTPMVGSMVAELLKHRRAESPNYIAGVDRGRQGINTFSFGSAYLSPSTHPFFVTGDPADPKFAINNLDMNPANQTGLSDRVGLLGQLERPLSGADLAGHAEGIPVVRQKALELITSDKAKSAFDLTKEPEKVRERFGMHRYGQRALMARRLVEHGASWVSMVMENATPPGVGLQKDHCYNWDSHAVNCHIFEDTKYKLGFLDQSISALITDLYERGLDRRVMLVVTGEFGRTPKVNYKDGRPGRDHWPQAMSILVTGGGMNTGTVVGSTTSKAEHPKDRPLTPNDLWATVFQHLNINYREIDFLDNSGRPMPMLPDGNPIRELI